MFGITRDIVILYKLPLNFPVTGLHITTCMLMFFVNWIDEHIKSGRIWVFHVVKRWFWRIMFMYKAHILKRRFVISHFSYIFHELPFEFMCQFRFTCCVGCIIKVLKNWGKRKDKDYNTHDIVHHDWKVAALSTPTHSFLKSEMGTRLYIYKALIKLIFYLAINEFSFYRQIHRILLL